MNLNEITPLILTYNEEANLRRTLDTLRWASRIVLIDSGSTDGTQQIAASYTNTEWIHRPFDCHTNQWNAGLMKVTTSWVLTLDADYAADVGLPEELSGLDPSLDGYFGHFDFHIFGHKLRGSLYPPRPMLFRTEKFRYVADGHTQSLDRRQEPFGNLASQFIHDDRKSFSRWVHSQVTYAELEAEKLSAIPKAQWELKDRIRSWIIPASILTVGYCLFYKRLIFDGRAGLYYTLQRTIAEMLLALKLLDSSQRKKQPKTTESAR